MKILTVVGARPNYMKAAPIVAAIADRNERVATLAAGGSGSPVLTSVLVHTGQHYDQLMSDSFFADLDLPTPDVALGVGSASQAVQTAEIMRRFEEVLLRERPDVVVVVGDVNSTLACALTAAKISFDASGARPIVAHVEAGLRSFDRAMPEEINRIVTDHLSDLLFVTEESGLRNLKAEGVPAERVHFVGNTMIDSLLASRSQAESSVILERLGLRPETAGGREAPVARYGLLTLHRPSNVDDRKSLEDILAGLDGLLAECPVVFPAHPRTRHRLAEFGLEERLADAREGGHQGIVLIDPLGYLDFLCLMQHAGIVVTDSGGIQEETTILGVPCVTVRDNTERPVTVDCGTNVVAGTSRGKIRAAIRLQLQGSGAHSVPELWDGHAATRIVDVLLRNARNDRP